MILCDVGNTRMHFLDRGGVVHASYEEGLERYGDREVAYICVNEKMGQKLRRLYPRWRDLEPCGRAALKSPYRGLGIDRAALILGTGHGVVIDAGSAVTVDIVVKGEHRGGWIMPGLNAWQKALAGVSKRLDLPLKPPGGPELPLKTVDAVGFGFFEAIKCLVDRYGADLPLKITGGNASAVAAALPGGRVDETLIFRGMEIMLKESTC